MSRFVGIVHRVKQTAEGEARPTMVCILGGKKPVILKLETETDELDFLAGRYPVAYSDVVDGEGLEKFLQQFLKRQIITKKNKVTGKEEPVKVPIEFEGLKRGDTVAMTLGGSGGYLAYAIARRCQELGLGEVGDKDTQIVRVTPKNLCAARGDTRSKDDDAELLAIMARDVPESFLPMHQVDLDQIRLQLAWRDRMDAMKSRIACEQRLYQRLIGRVFIGEGLAPEWTLEEEFLATKASDTILLNLEAEESERNREIEKLVHSLPIWEKLFEPIEGCGPMMTARLIVAIGDIRRFSSDAKLKSFCGTRPTADGKFLRRRQGEVANWSPEARQALFLFGEQMNRRPNSVWGQRLIAYKATLQERHPEVVLNDKGKKMYTKGHIHKMAIWRTLSKFVEWLWREWPRVADEEAKPKPDSNSAAA